LLAARDVSARVDAVPVPRALARFVRECGLNEFDVALLLIAAAPDLDLRYERLYAYLQDDVEKRRPTVDLALDLLCGSLASKVRRRTHFASDAPLLVHRLIHLVSPGAAAEAPLLAQRLQPQVLAALLGGTQRQSHASLRAHAGRARVLLLAQVPRGRRRGTRLLVTRRSLRIIIGTRAGSGERRGEGESDGVPTEVSHYRCIGPERRDKRNPSDLRPSQGGVRSRTSSAGGARVQATEAAQRKGGREPHGVGSTGAGPCGGTGSLSHSTGGTSSDCTRSDWDMQYRRLHLRPGLRRAGTTHR
jgi:winged helix domain-containing protein